MKKILVVDDDPEMRLALQIRLKAAQYSVFTANDGLSAITEARKHQPELILLDLGMPAGDGYVTLERLKANDAFRHLPVVVVSGRDRSTNEPRARNSGAACFLQKPVRHTELLSTVAKLLSTETQETRKVYQLDCGLASPSY